MALYVMTSGTNANSITPNTTEGNAGHNVNFDTPTNPIIHNTDTTASKYICAEIRTDNSSATTIVKQNTGAYNVYLENLEATAGYRVKCYDDTNGNGQRLNTLNLTTHDYFILLYADDNTQHHFAKITALKTDDVSGDALEFTPKLGNEIPKGTKFSVFRGPTVSDTSVVAITAGLLVDSTTTHNTSLICSRPLFYFYNDRLNKKNELDHNIKYKLCYEKGTATSPTLGTVSVFITQPDYGLQIVDKSKYGLHVEIIDNRRRADDPKLHTAFYTIADSVTNNDYTNYHLCFPNSRREINDRDYAVAGGARTGPYTYLHYEDSPMKVNNPLTIFSSKVYDSLGNRSGYAESRFIDVGKSFTSKYTEGDNYAIRQTLKNGDIADWFELPITINAISNHITTFDIPNNYDLRLLFGYNEEIKVGNYIGTVSNIAAPNYTAMTQQITFNSFYRLNTASVFSSLSANPASVDDVGYRRTWSPATRTFMIDFPLQTEVSYTFSSHLDDHPISTSSFTYKINDTTLTSYTESRFYNSYLLMADTNYELTESRVLFDDKIHSCLRLDPPRSHYRPVADTRTSFDYSFRKFSLELEIFTGTIEEIKNTLEAGQPIFEVSGRNNFSKLISPIVNKNTLYTQDMIYSHIAPLQKITKLTSGSGDVSFNANVAMNATSGVVNAAPTNLEAGDYLFNADGLYIGEVSSISTTTINISTKVAIDVSSSDVLYKQVGKPYVFTKALQASNKNTESFSSLTGASNRGVFFTSGVSLDSSGDKAASLAGTSSNTNENAVGNHLNSIQKIKNDGAFQAILKDEYGSTTFTSDVVNALSDFIVLSINKEEEETTIELAPRVPLFLGRVDEFDIYDSTDMTTTDTGITVANANTLKPYLEITSTAIDSHFKRNEPVFLENSGGTITFAGYFIRGTPPEATSISGSNYVVVLLDREVNSASGDKIHKINSLTSGANNDTTGMYFLNRPTSHMLQLAGQVSGANGLQLFNIDTTATTSTDSTYINQYGHSTYKIIDIEEGQYDAVDEYPKQIATTNETVENYYNNPSKTNFFALAYRFNSGYITSPTLTNASKDPYSPLHYRQGLFEKRGNKPSRGTNFSDFYLTNHTDNKFLSTNRPATNWTHRTWERTLRQMDAKVSRNFLFVSSDLLPCTSKRTDSLFKSGRDLTDFNIMLRTKGTNSSIGQTHTKYLGAGKSISNADRNVAIASINSAPDISSLKRFSMLRLVEMTLDWHFNSVDAENLPDKDKVLSCFTAHELGHAVIIKNGSTELTISSYGTGQITMSATPDNIIPSKNYDIFSESGYYVGRMSNFSSAVLTFSSGPFINESYALTTGGKLYAVYISNSVASTDVYWNSDALSISGHGSDDTFVKMGATDSFSMLKGAVINSNLMSNAITFNGYSEDDTDDYHSTYLPDNSDSHIQLGSLRWNFSIRDLMHDSSHRAQIALPPTFPSVAAFGTSYDFRVTDGTDNIDLDAGNCTEGASTIRVIRDGGGTATIQSGNLNDNVQYDLFVKGNDAAIGHYLGRTTAQTFTGNSITMETNFFKLEMTVGGTKAFDGELWFSLVPNHSMITTHGNTHKSEVIRSLAKNRNRYLFSETLPVFLDRYDIEDGGQAKVSQGLVSDEIEETIQIDGNMKVATQPHKVMLKTRHGSFAEFKSPETLARSADGNTPYIADGAVMLFKPFLRFYDRDSSNSLWYGTPTAETAYGDTTSGVYEVVFEVDNLNTGTKADKDFNAWLNFAPNLTGCYLVSNKGSPYGKQATVETSYYPDTDGTYDSLNSFADKITNRIHYIISHTMNRTSNATRHVFLIDNVRTTGLWFDDVYRVMRVAENTFYDFSPKEIIPYVPSAKYTKKAYSDETYKDLKSYRFNDKRGGRTISEDRGSGSAASYSDTGFNEAVCSMYVIADPDRQGSGDHLTYRNVSDVFGSLLNDGDSINVAMNDTRKTIKTGIQIRYDTTNKINEMKFSEMGSMIGATSIGEIFSITTIENIKGNYIDAHIGSTVNVGFESDALLNDLFESEGLTLTEQDNTQYPLFISPEFKGTDLMAAANFILERKDKTLVYDDGFYLRDSESELFRPNIFIEDMTDKYLIKSVKLETGLFDLYNEIIVYGRNLKSVRKNLRSIKKHGKKSLTIRDENLYTQYDVDRRASKLLRLHSRPSNRISLEVKGDDVFLLKPADRISVEIRSQNIPREDYVILEMEYTLNNFTKLILGKATKGMEDRFSELLVENKKVNSSLRPKTFKEPSVSTDLFDSFKIKEIRIKARKRTTGSGSFTLGFSTALNIGSTAMGFSSGASITYTDLFEEELI